MACRDNFLKVIKYFDYTYTTLYDDQGFYKIIVDEAKKKDMSIKEFLKSRDNPLCYYSQLNYKKIKHISLDDESVFKPFYSLNNEKIYLFAYYLHLANLFLKYFFEYNIDSLRRYEERKALQTKYKAVIEDIISVKLLKKDDLEILKDRMRTLHLEKTLTKRRIFEHFLVGITLLLIDNREVEKPTERISKIVNKIIAVYFDENIKFSKNTNFKKFYKHDYYFETNKPISLYHS